MNRLLLLLLISLITNWLPGQNIKTIGTTHIGSRELPLGMYFGFERSASLFTKTEIGGFCFITSLGWEVQAGNLESCPTKIYLKQTPLATLSQTTWDNMITGATLVYDAISSFPATGWHTIDIADFTYWSAVSSTNLLVLCETNYGEIPPLNYPWFWYSLTSNKKHEFWRNNDLPPAGNGKSDTARPNIQITYMALSDHNPPSGFMATPAGTFQIDLSWIRNSVPDDVMIAYNTTNTFGTPLSGVAYVPGNLIAGGGTVIYNGSGTSFSQTTDLGPATTYYYKAWSVISSPLSYSSGTLASAATLCEVTSTFPFSTDFENVLFPPSCWSLAGKPWMRFSSASGYGSGAVSAKASFYNIAVGNFDIISPEMDISSMMGPVVKFDHAYATGVSGVVDRLELWYSTDNGNTYEWLFTWQGGINGPLNTAGAVSGTFIPTSNQWATKSHELPPLTNKIMLRGVSAYGNNLYLDNIVYYDTISSVTWNGNISSDWNNASNWTPYGIPNELQTVRIPEGMQHNPIVNTTGLSCKHLTIYSGAAVIVGNSSEITVNGNMTIQNGAFLINMGLVTVKGNLDIQN